jgi:hypothetical protein
MYSLMPLGHRYITHYLVLKHSMTPRYKYLPEYSMSQTKIYFSECIALKLSMPLKHKIGYVPEHL